MLYKAGNAVAERPAFTGTDGLLYREDIRLCAPYLLERYAGKVQCVYIDPPFASGQTYKMRVFVGEDDWSRGIGSLERNAYTDPSDAEAAGALLRDMIACGRELLTDTGLLFVHVDWRLSGRARMLLDEMMGEDHIVNEIIYSYQTGGRAKNHFSRKHDTIFMYKKGRDYDFHIEAVGVQRADTRRNHMKRMIDADGRAYRTITSGGKVYTYYDDDITYLGDVWDDLQMQQKDPQRTGYETQKPLKLLERIILCSTVQGDLVADLSAGSGTTAEAAARLKRRFIAVDRSEISLLAMRRRLTEAETEIFTAAREDAPLLDAECAARGIGEYAIRLNGFSDVPENEVNDLDRVDGWAAGYIRDGIFLRCAGWQRTRAKYALVTELTIPVLDGIPAVRVNDVYGGTSFYTLQD